MSKNQSRPNRGLEDLIEVSSHGAFQRLLLPFCTVEGEITGRLKLNQPSFWQGPLRNLSKTLDLRLGSPILHHFSFSSYFSSVKEIFFFNKGDTKPVVEGNYACLGFLSHTQLNFRGQYCSLLHHIYFTLIVLCQPTQQINLLHKTYYTSYKTRCYILIPNIILMYCAALKSCWDIKAFLIMFH